ncbi:unnamed protein product, partial [Mesorhabditis belari]|uniref:RING-type domain-containing protein n=1 Tax=Mesorhabditis belari TaxID=2138241 RepID=A0AAF3EYY9_9BILA
MSIDGNEENGEEIEDDDEEDLEPRLHYELLGANDVKQLFQKSLASSIACHAKFLAIGTHHGQIFVMDHLGNVDYVNLPPYHLHRGHITRLCIDESGSYVASCAGDARVVVHGIGTSEFNQQINLKTVARSIALSPDYARRDSGQRVLIGERNLLMFEKGYLTTKETILFRGSEKDGFITALSWRRSLIAFTNEQGTRVLEKVNDTLITHVLPTHDVDRMRSTRFLPYHCWLDDENLAIGWADTVIVLTMTRNEQTRQRYGEIRYTWQLSMGLSGISHIPKSSNRTIDIDDETIGEPWGELIVFGLKPGEEADESGVDAFCDLASVASMSTSSSPSVPPTVFVAILEPESTNAYELQAEDKIGFTTHSHSMPAHFAMCALPEFDTYFLMGPKEIVTATPNCADDVVQWRRDHGRLEEAWTFALQHIDELTNPDFHPSVIAKLLIESLLEEGRAKYAASLLPEMCKEQKSEWENFVSIFEEAGRLLHLAEALPTQSPQLEPEIYEEVLHTALYHDLKLFRRLVSKWSPDLYRVGALTALTMQRIHEGTKSDAEKSIQPDEEKDLYHALANLYIADRKYDLALKIYFSSKEKYIFNVVKDQLTELMTIDKDQALSLLLNNEMVVNPADVMTKIAREPRLQLAYLKKLFERNEGDEYADQMVSLLAEYDRPQLLPFLRKSKHYHTNRALEICSHRKYDDERVFLLVKSGNRREALNVMVQQQNRLDKAIDLCREHEDDELWSLLVNEVVSSRSPANISQLLATAGTSIDPLGIIEKIPEDLEIPGLRDLLVKILRDYETQVMLQWCCHSATLDDVRGMSDLFYKQANRATHYGQRSVCAICRSKLFLEEKREELQLFGCGHAVHSRCFEEKTRRDSHLGTTPSKDCPVCAEEDGMN